MNAPPLANQPALDAPLSTFSSLLSTACLVFERSSKTKQAVGATRFERATSCSQSRRSARLSYAPVNCLLANSADQMSKVRVE